MSRLKPIYLLSLFSFLSFQQAVGQERLQDAELWLKIAAEAKLSKKLEIGLEEQIRFDQNISELKSYFTEMALGYDLSEQIALLGRLRYTTRNDNSGATQGEFNFLRYQLGTRIKHRTGQFRFSHRLLYQRADRVDIRPDEGDIIVKYFRYRFKTEYKIKNWSYDPEVSLEYFRPFENPLDDRPDAIRLNVGTENSLDNIGTFGIQYRYEWTVNYAFPRANHIIALSYSYNF